MYKYIDRFFKITDDKIPPKALGLVKWTHQASIEQKNSVVEK